MASRIKVPTTIARTRATTGAVPERSSVTGAAQIGAYGQTQLRRLCGTRFAPSYLSLNVCSGWLRSTLELRSTQVEVERDESRSLDTEIRRVERALTDSAVEAMKAGLPAGVIRDATSELTQQFEALQKRRAMIEAWKEDSEQQSRRMRKLWELAERAHSRLMDATCIVQKEVLDLLDVRVSILDEHKDSRTRKIRIEGIVANLDRIVDNVTL